MALELGKRLRDEALRLESRVHILGIGWGYPRTGNTAATVGSVAADITVLVVAPLGRLTQYGNINITGLSDGTGRASST
jgi:hypothetical protein